MQRLLCGLVVVALVATSGCGSDHRHAGDAEPAADGAAGDATPAGSDIADTHGEESPFAVTAVHPSEGPVYGDELVAVTGRGFVDGVRLFFGESEAHGVVIVGQGYLEARTPAGPPGFTTVRAQWPDGTAAVLERGYLYVAPISVESVAPAIGPTSGGTPIVVKGHGFDDHTRLFIGDHQAVVTRTVDARTLTGLTPEVSRVGPVDVLVGGPGGYAVLPEGFRYLGDARVHDLHPRSGPTAGGTVVEIRTDVVYPDVVVYFGSRPATDVAAEDGRILATTPPGEAGAVDVMVRSADASASAIAAFHYLPGDPTSGPVRVAAVIPDRGPAEGGAEVVVIATGLAEGGDTHVSFGGAAATVTSADRSDLTVTTPPGTLGWTDVTVTQDAEEDTLVDGFRYVTELSMDGVVPPEGRVEGGDLVTLRGVGFADGVDTVRFGALAATDVEILDDTTVELRTPPGAPGNVAVTIVREAETLRVPDAFAYRATRMSLAGLSPRQGSTAGGTEVHVLGEGLTGAQRVLFGGAPADITARVDDAHLVVRSPRHRAGTVDVEVVGRDDDALLAAAYTFVRPDQGDGGTSGPNVIDTVNVAVMDAFTEEPIASASVVLRGENTQEWRDRTNDEGLVTFSAAGLRGRLDVSAAHPEYSAGSIVAFDATNVTLLLYPKQLPDLGGNPGRNLEPGLVSGTVVWDDKGRIVPFGRCSGTHAPGVLCTPCVGDLDCAPEGVCTRLGDLGRYCTTPCAGEDDCPTGFECRRMGRLDRQCVPEAGQTAIQCLTTAAYPGAENPLPGAGAVVGPDMQYAVATRLEELAIVCTASVQQNLIGPGTPFAMGVRRHILPRSGEELTGQDVVLDIPLTGELRIRLDDPPHHPAPEAEWLVAPYLYFGAEGVLRLPKRTRGTQETFTLTRLPLPLGGSIEDTTILVLAVQSPREEASSHLDFFELDRSTYSLSWTSADGSPDEGPMLQGPPDALAPEVPPIAIDILGLAVDRDGELWAVGDDGKMVRRGTDGVWYVEAAPAPVTLHSVWHGGAEGLWVVGGDGVIMRYTGGLWSFVDGSDGLDMLAVTGDAEGGVVAVGARGKALQLNPEPAAPMDTATTETLRAVALDAQGAVWVAGDAGVVRRITPDEGATDVDIPTATTIRALAALPDGLLAVGDGGAAFFYDGAAWQGETTGTSRDLHAVAVVDLERAVAVGDDGVVVSREADGSWSRRGVAGVRTDLRAITALPDDGLVTAGYRNVLVSPIVPVAHFVRPTEGVPLGLGFVEWDAAPGIDPTLQLLTLTQVGALLPAWEIFLAGNVRAVDLPDFGAIAGFEPLVDATFRLELVRIYDPSVSVDEFSMYDVWFGGAWPSVAVSTIQAER